jgi:hypothetical protein
MQQRKSQEAALRNAEQSDRGLSPLDQSDSLSGDESVELNHSFGAKHCVDLVLY